MSTGEYCVPTAAIKQAVWGHEAAVLTALSIPWQGGKAHIRCPYPDHTDEHASWRWDEQQARARCTCIEGGDDVFEVVKKVTGCDFEGNSADRGGAIAMRAIFDDIDATFQDCIFSDNLAHLRGGAIHIDAHPAFADARASLFLLSHEQYGGGGRWRRGGAEQ